MYFQVCQLYTCMSGVPETHKMLLMSWNRSYIGCKLPYVCWGFKQKPQEQQVPSLLSHLCCPSLIISYNYISIYNNTK